MLPIVRVGRKQRARKGGLQFRPDSLVPYTILSATVSPLATRGGKRTQPRSRRVDEPDWERARFWAELAWPVDSNHLLEGF